MKFSIKDSFNKCDQIRTADLVTFAEEILNGKLHYFYSVMSRLAVNKSEFCRRNASAKSKEPLTLYSLNVKSFSIGTKN